MAFFKKVRKSGIILTGIFMVPLFSQGVVSQSVGAQSFLTDAPGNTENKFQDILLSSNTLKVLVCGVLVVTVILGLVYLLKNTPTTGNINEKKVSKVGIQNNIRTQNLMYENKKKKTGTGNIKETEKSTEENRSKRSFKEFCDKIVNSLDEGDAEVKREDDFIQFEYPSGFYFSIKIGKEKFPENCILTKGKRKKEKDGFGVEWEYPTKNFCEVKKMSENYVFEDRKVKFKSFAEQISKECGKKAEFTERRVKVSLENGITCFIVLKEEDIDGMFRPFSVFAKKDGKLFAKRKLFSRLSDAEGYFKNLVAKMKNENQEIIYKKEDSNT